MMTLMFKDTLTLSMHLKPPSTATGFVVCLHMAKEEQTELSRVESFRVGRLGKIQKFGIRE
jgi:hypothetical protein